ncbi:MAG: hypothetical protein GIX03_01855 [Candidatus Eremiobacteraeota bacterium]|nr:hypothetical protein [Candidatus Eremiobacteraeota bacterium]MBC5801763.1 hypothetical protein [Candidatus Eremiobacteraeota bacterium]MBC5823061.1 hypothetical protein [Candidatus Eremiobacteraeota bacterium]
MLDVQLERRVGGFDRYLNVLSASPFLTTLAASIRAKGGPLALNRDGLVAFETLTDPRIGAARNRR